MADTIPQTSVFSLEGNNSSASTYLESEKERSQVINALRFPMAAGVVFIHSSVSDVVKDAIHLSEWVVADTANVTMRTFFQMAVPLFFLISGFLFFRSFQKEWNWGIYREKLRRRVSSLLIPYLLWNVIEIVSVAQNSYRADLDFSQQLGGLNGIGDIFRLFWSAGLCTGENLNAFGFVLSFNHPVNAVLWFVRDLIVMVLFAPLVYYLVRKNRVALLIVLTTLFIMNYWLNLPGTSPSAFLFFTAGAYFSMYNVDFISVFVGRWKWLVASAAVLFVLAIVAKREGWLLKRDLENFYVLFAVPATIAVCTCLHRMGKMGWSIRLAPTSFFVYASHFVSYIGFLALSKHTLRIIFGEPSWEWQAVLMYFTNPLLAILLCVLAYKVLARFLPRLTSVLCGGRG